MSYSKPEGPVTEQVILLPCPFCGARASLWASTDTEWIQCSKCLSCSDVYAAYTKQAEQSWNKRVGKE